MNIGIHLAAAALITVPPVFSGAFECSYVIVRSSCFQAIGANVSEQGESVSVGGVVFDNVDPERCPKLKKVCVTMYNEKNQKPGYQSPDPGGNPPDPGDELIDQKCGDVAVPSDTVAIGSFTNTNDQGKAATHWEIVAEDENQEETEFSGTF